MGYYDPSLKAWIAEKGDFEVLIGASSVDIRYVNLFPISVLLILT